MLERRDANVDGHVAKIMGAVSEYKGHREEHDSIPTADSPFL